MAFYPEGTLTRDPDHVADGRQDRRRPRRPAHQGARSSRSPSGAPTSSCRRTRRSPASCRARPTACSPAPPVDLTPGTTQEPTAEVLREVTEAIMAAVTALLAELRGEPAPAGSYDPRKAATGAARRQVTARCAVFGTGSWGTAFAHGARRRRLRGRRCGAAGPNSSTPSTPPAPTPTTSRASTLPAAVTRHRRPGARPPRGAEFVFLAVPSQSLRANLAAWAPLLRPGRGAGQPDEGRRTRHRQADERGHRGGRHQGRPPRTASRAVPGPTSPRRSPPGSPPRPSSPAATSRWPAAPDRLPHRRTSARTPTPTWSAANSAARSRT